MKVAKRIVCIVLLVLLCVGLVGCNTKKETDNKEYKLNIVTSMFPYYDIVRAVIGQVEGINLEMAVSPGQDSHSFEPTPADIIKMEEADLFIYNGGGIEAWVDEVINSFDNSNQIQIKMMDEAEGIELQCSEGHVHGKNSDEHNSEQIDEQQHHESEHSHDEIDPHIWTSPINEIIITEVICDTLCQAVPQEAEDFKNNANKYIKQLEEIDREFRDIVSEAEVKELIFADQFPLIYFIKEYGLKYHAAFSGCGHDMEPSAKDICDLIDEIKTKDIKAVFHLELSSKRVAETICQDTGAMKLQFNSCHNVSQKQFNEGVTYVELMRENVENLKQALN